MRFFAILLLCVLPVSALEKDSKDTAKIEMILRQQRELEANELMLNGKKHQIEGRLEDALSCYSKAIHLYEKSSSSEKRIINRINDSRILLVSVYKSLADKVITQAEKESSVELFDKAKALLNEAQKQNSLIRKSR